MTNDRRTGLITVMLLGAILIAPMLASVTTYLYPQKEKFWTGRLKVNDHRYSKHNHTMFFRDHYADTCWNSWAKFDLSMVPDDAIIEEAIFCYRVVQITKPCPSTVVRVVDVDPVTSDAYPLHQSITTGTVVSPNIDQKKGWVDRPLNTGQCQS